MPLKALLTGEGFDFYPNTTTPSTVGGFNYPQSFTPVFEGQFRQKLYKFGQGTAFDRPNMGFSGQPFITIDNRVDILSQNPETQFNLDNYTDGTIRGGAILNAERLTTDVKRIGSFFITGKGITFLGIQEGLQLTNPQIREGTVFKPAKSNNRTYNLGINTLAQVALQGTGEHIKREGLLPTSFDGYIDDLTEDLTLANLPKDEEGEKRAAIGEGNRLLNLFSSEIFSFSPPEPPKERSAVGQFFYDLGQAFTNAGGNTGGAELYSYPGGPNSLYGIGTTTIRKYAPYTTEAPNYINRGSTNAIGNINRPIFNVGIIPRLARFSVEEEEFATRYTDNTNRASIDALLIQRLEADSDKENLEIQISDPDSARMIARDIYGNDNAYFSKTFYFGGQSDKYIHSTIHDYGEMYYITGDKIKRDIDTETKLAPPGTLGATFGEVRRPGLLGVSIKAMATEGGDMVNHAFFGELKINNYGIGVTVSDSGKVEYEDIVGDDKQYSPSSGLKQFKTGGGWGTRTIPSGSHFNFSWGRPVIFNSQERLEDFEENKYHIMNRYFMDSQKHVRQNIPANVFKSMMDEIPSYQKETLPATVERGNKGTIMGNFNIQRDPLLFSGNQNFIMNPKTVGIHVGFVENKHPFTGTTEYYMAHRSPADTVGEPAGILKANRPLVASPNALPLLKSEDYADSYDQLGFGDVGLTPSGLKTYLQTTQEPPKGTEFDPEKYFQKNGYLRTLFGTATDFRRYKKEDSTETFSTDYQQYTNKKATGGRKFYRESRVGLGTPGKPLWGKSANVLIKGVNKEGVTTNTYDLFDQDTIDQINALDIFKANSDSFEFKEVRDMIRFRIEALEGDNPSQSEVMVFRAFLDSYGDKYTGDWNKFKYNGRAEDFYTYKGFKRSISFGFKIAAQTRHEMMPIYRKLNFLVSQTAPDYKGTRMRGNICRLTIGSMIDRVPGFFNSISLKWNKNYPWDISINHLEDGADKDGAMVMPHVLDVSCTYTPIHNFIPKKSVTQSPFILPDRNARTLKDKQDWAKEDSAGIYSDTNYNNVQKATIKGTTPTPKD